jgi:outer membrane protein assembly factor BamE
MKLVRLFTALCIAFTLAGCGIVYKLPTRQGNVIEQKQLDQLKQGMTREQVKFLMGTALAASPFRQDRWDYVGYYKTPRGKLYTRTVSLYFENDKLARMDGIRPEGEDDNLESPDMQSVIDQEKKARREAQRAKDDKEQSGGVNIPTSPDDPEPSKLPNP